MNPPTTRVTFELQSLYDKVWSAQSWYFTESEARAQMNYRVENKIPASNMRITKIETVTTILP